MIWSRPLCVTLLRRISSSSLSTASFRIQHRYTIRPMSTSSISASPAGSPETQVNLLDLAASALASTVAASRPIRERSSIHDEDDNAPASSHKNARLKGDGSVVTDADFAAQGTIVRMLRTVSKTVMIVGEESEEEMMQHTDHTDPYKDADAALYDWAHAEVHRRYKEQNEELKDRPDIIVNSTRVRIFVDPLDGTKSYANGDYDSVTVLIAIILDNRPYFGVICKPFGYDDKPTMLDTGCVAIYGGELLNGVFLAGGPACATPTTKGNLPRAVISSSRSEGLVQDFVNDLAARNVLNPDFILCSGAGAKSLLLVLPTRDEALWFFPKSGTSRWDIAASDALLRQLGGKVTDKFGNELDYLKSREESENSEGIIASNDADLHAEVVKLFLEGKWIDRYPDES